MSFHECLLIAQAEAAVPQTWIGVVGAAVVGCTTIMTRLLVRIDKRLVALEMAVSDLAQSNLFRVLAGDAAPNTKREAQEMLTAMNKRRTRDDE